MRLYELSQGIRSLSTHSQRLILRKTGASLRSISKSRCRHQVIKRYILGMAAVTCFRTVFCSQTGKPHDLTCTGRRRFPPSYSQRFRTTRYSITRDIDNLPKAQQPVCIC